MQVCRILESSNVHMGQFSALHVQKLLSEKLIASYKAKNMVSVEYFLAAKKEIGQAEEAALKKKKYSTKKKSSEVRDGEEEAGCRSI